MSTSAAGRALLPPRAAIAAAAVAVRAVPEPAVLAVAAALRLSDLERVPGDPYYDAAVRTMGASWQAFLAGAFEPGRRVAIDKPAPGLWLQVLSTRLFGFHTWALLLPAALGGVAAVAAVMWVARSLAGRWAGVAAGAALAVLPAAVVTSRSDTMDAVMAALAVVAFGLALRAARSGRLARWPRRARWPGWRSRSSWSRRSCRRPPSCWPGCSRAPARRWAGAALWSAAFAACALGWLVAVTVVPLHPRPWALGSAGGSPWNAALVYDGIDRLLPGARPQGAAPAPVSAARTAAGRARRSARERAAAAARAAPPGPLRLVSARRRLDTWFGLEAVAALAALAVALALRRRTASPRARPTGGMGAGRVARRGLALCSAMPDLRPRYLELVDPAVAGVLGIAVARLGRPGAAVGGARPRRAPSVSVGAVRSGAQDSGDAGALPAARVAALSGFLAAHPGGLAAAAPGAVAPLIADDGRPVLLLSDGRGRQLVTPAALERSGVRYALLGPPCAPGDSGCEPVVRWVRAHARAVTVGGGPLYVITRACAPAARGRTPTSTRSRRTAPAADRCGRRPASRGARRRAAGARRRSAARSRST